MKKYCALFITAAMVLGLSTSALAAGGSVKIGYFDATGAAMQSEFGKKVDAELKHEYEKLASELDQRVKAFNSESQEFEKKRDVMDQKARDRKQKELQDKMAELQKIRTESTQQYEKFANQKRSPLFVRIREIATKIGKDEKYDFIVEKSALHYANDKDDLTKRVAAELDKNPPK